MIILVLLCLLTIALKWLPKMIKLDGQIETISTIYATSIANELENMSPDDCNSLADSTVLIKDFLLKSSAPLVKPTCKNKKCGKVFIKLPEDVKKARFQGNVAFNSWKLLNYPLEGDISETYCASRKEYRQKLRIFFSQPM